jgi:starch-binding outer membrane protein, SusD/RagB family
MSKPSSLPKSLGPAGRRAWLLAPAALLAALSCTDLTETPRSALTPANAFRTRDDIMAGLTSVYASLRGAPENGYFNLSEISSNEIIVPTRGQDWYDNGRWLEIYRQAWTANSGSALDDMNGTWNDLFSGVSRANLVLNAIEQAQTPGQDTVVAELRTLRAYYYYLLMDFFGGVPIVTDTKVEQRPRNTREEVFRFVETELNAARGTLPAKWDATNYGRVTKGVADAILASMYLNAQVYLGQVTPSGLTRGPARWAEAATAADRILNSGVYQLATNYQSNFALENESSPENIFVVVHVPQPDLGMTFAMRTLHYNQLVAGDTPWNGFAAVAETYNAYDAADTRRNIWLVGPQRSFNTGQPITDRAGAPLVFTVDIANPEQASEGEGPRMNKYPPLPGAPSGSSQPNDFVIFRLGEIYLIKAEALNEQGQTAQAITLLNQLRARAFSPQKPLSASLSQAQVRDAILNERLFELALEAKRRQDLIRAGTYTAARRFKQAQPAYKVLFPIPATQIQTNPLLTQNPGY